MWSGMIGCMYPWICRQFNGCWALDRARGITWKFLLRHSGLASTLQLEFFSCVSVSLSVNSIYLCVMTGLRLCVNSILGWLLFVLVFIVCCSLFLIPSCEMLFPPAKILLLAGVLRGVPCWPPPRPSESHSIAATLNWPFCSPRRKGDMMGRATGRCCRTTFHGSQGLRSTSEADI